MPDETEQLRVLRLVPGAKTSAGEKPVWSYQVEIWQQGEKKSKRSKTEWLKVETRTPLRLGKPLPLIPFVFHGPRHSLPSVDKLPLAEWVDALVSDAPHLFEANAGGGAAGNGSGGAGNRSVKNPFRKETWNLTEQMKLQKSDPALAARLKAAA